MTLAAALPALKSKSDLTAEDALAMRRAVFAEEAVIDPAEADALVDINAAAITVAREWRDFFAEAITDFVVRQQSPVGYVSEAQADWLISACLRHGRLRDDELDALVHVLEAAEQSPARLSGFVLESLKRLALWRIEHQHRLAGTDILRLKRLLFAMGGAGDIGVTRSEAEALFDINDALGDSEVEGDWRGLFVSAIANCVLFQSTWAPNASRARDQEAWLADLQPDPMKRLADTRSAGEGVLHGLHALLTWDFDNQAWAESVEARSRIQEQAEVLTNEEATWLFDRLGRNGRLDDHERALCAFIQENAHGLSPLFRQRLDALSRL